VPGLPVPDDYLRTYTSIPQAGLDNRTSPLHTGAVVGGGTVVNGMFFNRGSAGDYDVWEELGNPGWGWSDLLPYFKKVGQLHLSIDDICYLSSRVRHLHRHLKRYKRTSLESFQMTCRLTEPTDL